MIGASDPPEYQDYEACESVRFVRVVDVYLLVKLEVRRSAVNGQRTESSIFLLTD